MNKKLDVWIDFDDVIVNSSSVLVKAYNIKFKDHPDFKPAKCSEIYYYDASEEMPLANKQFIIDVFNSDFFFENCEFFQKAKDTLARLYMSNLFEINIISIGTSRNIHNKRNWINKNLNFITNDKIILIEREDCATGKMDYLPENNEYVIIDDHIENLNCESKYKILFKPHGERFYNREYYGATSHTWVDLEKLLFGIVNDKIRMCSICGQRQDACVNFRRNSKFGKNICNRHYTQLSNYGKIFDRTIFDKNKIILKDDYAEIAIVDKKDGSFKARVKIDLKMVKFLSRYKWCLRNGYPTSRIDGKVVAMHRLILNPKEGFVTDHINRDKTDNRLINLRYATKAENGWNTNVGLNNTSGSTGVHWNKIKGKWQVYIKIHGKRISLGYFSDYENAKEKRRDAEIKYYDEFAPINKEGIK